MDPKDHDILRTLMTVWRKNRFKISFYSLLFLSFAPCYTVNMISSQLSVISQQIWAFTQIRSINTHSLKESPLSWFCSRRGSMTSAMQPSWPREVLPHAVPSTGKAADLMNSRIMMSHRHWRQFKKYSPLGRILSVLIALKQMFHGTLHATLLTHGGVVPSRAKVKKKLLFCWTRGSWCSKDIDDSSIKKASLTYTSFLSPVYFILGPACMNSPVLSFEESPGLESTQARVPWHFQQSQLWPWCITNISYISHCRLRPGLY